MGRRLALALLASLAVASPGAAEALEWRVRNTASAGLILDLPHHGGVIGGELLLAERLRVQLGRPGTDVELVFDGRSGLRLGAWTPQRTRIRAAGARIETAGVHLEIGRHPVIDGGWRLVDGVQALVRPWRAMEVGGWLGLLPDPWTTAPAPRFGGGPIVRWRGAHWQAAVVGELAGTPTGLDRLALRASGRFEIGRIVDLSGRLEVASGGSAAVRVEEAGIAATLSPARMLTVRAGWSVTAGRAFLQGVQRDPALDRWWQRWTGVSPSDPLPWEEATDAATHVVRADIVWKPRTGGPIPWLATRARAGLRPSAVDRSTARIGVEGGAIGLLGGRLDLGLGGAALRWGGDWRAELGAEAWLGPDRDGALSIEASGRLWIGRRHEDGALVPSVAADLYVDWRIVKGLSVAAGYRLDNDLDSDRWNTVHTALARVRWTLDRRGGAP